MGDFLGCDDVIKSTLPRNKPILLMSCNLMDNSFEMVGQNFSDDFVTNIAEENRTKIRRENVIVLFRN